MLCSYCHTEVLWLNSVQFKMVSALGRVHIYMLSTLSHRSLASVAFESFRVSLTDNGPVLSFQGRSYSDSFFHASLLKVNGVMVSLALCQQVVSQALQHFRSSKTQAICDDCFAQQSICSSISLHSGMSTGVFEADVDCWHIPVWAFQ